MQERISETNCGTPPLNLVGPLPQLTLKKALGYRTVTHCDGQASVHVEGPRSSGYAIIYILFHFVNHPTHYTLHDPDQHRLT